MLAFSSLLIFETLTITNWNHVLYIHVFYIFPTCQTTQAKENVGHDVVRAITCQRIKNMFFFGKSHSNSKDSRAYLEYILIFP